MALSHGSDSRADRHMLTDDERRVATAVLDLSAGGITPQHGPATAAAVADHCSLCSRRFGVARASRTLGMLVERGIARRRRPKGGPWIYELVRGLTDQERG